MNQFTLSKTLARSIDSRIRPFSNATPIFSVASLFAALHATTTTVDTKEDTITSIVPTPWPTCEDGNLVYGASCYFFERERTFTWKEAKELCADMGATLWVPNCVDEWVRARRIFQKFTKIRNHCRIPFAITRSS